MAAKRVKKPEPISKLVVCSECGLSWEAHGEAPTLATCVELLKAEVKKRPAHAQTFAINPSSSVPIWNYTGGAN